MQFYGRDFPMTPPHRVRKNPHTSGTARQTRTSLKPYCCSTHLNVFKFKIVSVQNPFSSLSHHFHPRCQNTEIKGTTEFFCALIPESCAILLTCSMPFLALFTFTHHHFCFFYSLALPGQSSKGL